MSPWATEEDELLILAHSLGGLGSWPLGRMLLSIMVTGPCGRGCSLHGCSVTSHWGLFLLTPNREGNDALQVQQVKWWAYWDYTEKHGGLKGCMTKKCKERVAHKCWEGNGEGAMSLEAHLPHSQCNGHRKAGRLVWVLHPSSTVRA